MIPEQYPENAGFNPTTRVFDVCSTPLAWAERRGQPQIASILREHGATR